MVSRNRSGTSLHIVSQVECVNIKETFIQKNNSVHGQTDSKWSELSFSQTCNVVDHIRDGSST